MTSGAMIRMMFCEICRKITPHVVVFHGNFRDIEGTKEWVRVDCECIRKFRIGYCEHKTHRSLSVPSYNALVTNDYL